MAVKTIAARAPHEIDLTAADTMDVVYSVVTKGDISQLDADARTRYYVQMCESLGLSPAAQPFAVLKLNGKEILYPTRGATDQLAAIHRLNREIIDGPKVIDVGGSKIVYAVCKVTHPNGRVETSTGMVPLPSGADNICNAFLKTETKARRRATLSILGLGMLDETELDTIPASAKGEAEQIVLEGEGPDADVRYSAPNDPSDDEVLRAAMERLLAQPAPKTLDDCAAAYLVATKGVPLESYAQGVVYERVAQAAITAKIITNKAKLRGAIQKLQAAEREMPEAFAKFTADLEQIELPGEGVSVWIKHRPTLHALSELDKETAWKALCKRVEDVGRMGSAHAWLRRSIAEEDAHRHRPENSLTAAGDPQLVDEPELTEAQEVVRRAYTAALDAEPLTLEIVVAAWHRYKTEIATFPQAEKEGAWNCLVHAATTLTPALDEKGLRAALAPPKGDGPKGGKRTTDRKAASAQATAAPVASNDGPQSRVVIDDPQTLANAYLADFKRGVDLHAWQTHIDSKRHWHAMLSSLVKRAAVFDAEGLLPDRTRAVVDAVARAMRTTPELARAEMRRRLSEKNSGEVQALLLPVLGGHAVRRAA